MQLSNIYNYQKYEATYITKHSSGIKRQINAIAYSICYGDISKQYIEYALKHYTQGYVYRDTTNNDNIIAFSLWEIKHNHLTNEDELHIHLLCGRKMGKLIFDNIENYASRYNIKTITLDPVNNRIKDHYVKQYKFKLRGYNKHSKLDRYYKTINAPTNITRISKTLKRRNKNKRRTTYKKVKNISNNIFTSHNIINLGNVNK